VVCRNGAELCYQQTLAPPPPVVAGLGSRLVGVAAERSVMEVEVVQARVSELEAAGIEPGGIEVVADEVSVPELEELRRLTGISGAATRPTSSRRGWPTWTCGRRPAWSRRWRR
jgi:hypothetical protein